MSATGSPSEGGTTLIETLVALAVTSLVALVGFPRLQQSLLLFSQRQTAAIVAAQLRQVRAAALRGDRKLVFTTTADGRGFGAFGRVSRTPTGVELKSAPGGPIAFFGDGSSSGGVIWITAGPRSLPISVAPATGAVLTNPR